MNVLVDFIVSIVSTVLYTAAEHKQMNRAKKSEFNKFLEGIRDWCNEYISKNDSTVIAGQAFDQYCRNYNVIENIISYIKGPAGQSEEEFLESCYNQAVMYLCNVKSLSYDDQRALKGFINGVFEKTFAYYHDQIPIEHTIISYQNEQQNAKLDEILERIKIEKNDEPKEKNCPKKVYPMPPNTMMRSFTSYKELQECFSLTLRRENMLDVCIKEKHVVLLGEAGCGKSIALKQLAAEVSNTKFYPLYIQLNNYTTETIEQIIEEYSCEVDIEDLFLIFDAYDEIEPTNRNHFARVVSKFVQRVPDTIILISSRNNFYKFSDDNGYGGLFDSFKEYGIAPITDEDIKLYIEKNNVDYGEFKREIADKKLFDFFETPFYLNEFLKIYKKNQKLPQRSAVMEEIIYNRFNEDFKKYARTEELENYETKIISNLERLAFAFQCLHVQKISNTDYQFLIEEDSSRLMLSYSGIFSKEKGNVWQFEHNNFREYLTARYLNRFPLETIKNLMCDKQSKVFNSWVNVLAFLVSIKVDPELYEFLVNDNIEMIVKFERNRVDEKARNEIVVKILESYAQRNMWLSHGANSANDIAKFAQSKEFCQYLIEQILNPINFKAQNNALSVLSAFTDLFGMNNEIGKALSQCIKSEKTREYEKIKALESMAVLGVSTEDITSFVAKAYDVNASEQYRIGVLKYLNISCFYEEYFNLFIDEYILNVETHNGSIGIRLETLDVFTKIKSGENIAKILNAFLKNPYWHSSDENAYVKVIDNAIECYNGGDAQVFEYIFQSLSCHSVHQEELVLHGLKFFEKTNTKVKAFEKLIGLDFSKHLYNAASILMRLCDDACFEMLIDKYNRNPDKYVDIVRELAQRFKENTTMYQKYKKALEIHGVILEERMHFDYEVSRSAGQQYYFDSLFDKEQYLALLKRMLVSIDNESLTFDGLSKLKYHPVNYKSIKNKTEEFALLELVFGLRLFEKSESAILETIKNMILWNKFVAMETHRLLSQENTIEITEDQKNYLKSYCEKQLENMSIPDEISFGEGTSVTCTYRLWDIIFFSERYNFEYPKNVYYDMLKIPSHFFEEKEDNGYGRIPMYLIENLSQAELQAQIKNNLQDGNLHPEIVNMYISYCKEENIDIAIVAAKKICAEQTSDSWFKQNAIEYLTQVKGINYIYDEFLDTEDEVVIDCLVATTLKFSDARLKNRLEHISRESPDNHKYLSKLIALNSTYAIERYYDICKTAMETVCVPSDSYLDSAVNEISKISNVNQMEGLKKLQELLFSDGFKDSEEFGLWNGLYCAYQNIAKNNFQIVVEHLKDVLTRPDTSDAEKGFCNTLCYDIENYNLQRNDVTWSIPSIKEFWSNNE